MDKARRKWTLEEKLKVVAYKKQHGGLAAAAKFDVHATQIRRWERGEQLGETGVRGSQQKAARVAKEFGHTGNGSTPITDKRVKVALLHLERWKNGQRAHIRRGGVDNSYDLEAEHAYRTLRGEE